MKHLLFLALMISVATQVHSLSCYDCDSFVSPSCKDPLDTYKHTPMFCGNNSGLTLEQQLMQFAAEQTSSDDKHNNKSSSDVTYLKEESNLLIVCVKGVFRRDGDKEDIVWRACNYLGDDTCRRANQTASSFGLTTKFCGTCTTDACNAATSSIYKSTTALLVFAVSVLRLGNVFV